MYNIVFLNTSGFVLYKYLILFTQFYDAIAGVIVFCDHSIFFLSMRLRIKLPVYFNLNTRINAIKTKVYPLKYKSYYNIKDILHLSKKFVHSNSFVVRRALRINHNRLNDYMNETSFTYLVHCYREFVMDTDCL